MKSPTGNILKSRDVTFEGQYVLDLGQALAGPATCSAAIQARIAEQQADFAVLEITCRCGAKSYVRCDYAGA